MGPWSITLGRRFAYTVFIVWLVSQLVTHLLSRVADTCVLVRGIKNGRTKTVICTDTYIQRYSDTFSRRGGAACRRHRRCQIIIILPFYLICYVVLRI